MSINFKAHPSTPPLPLKDLDQRNMDKSEQELQSLREILFGDYQARIDALYTDLEQTNIKLDEAASRLAITESKLEQATIEVGQVRNAAAKQKLALLAEIDQLKANQIYRNQILDEVEPEIPRLVQASINDSQKEMIDALYPIMGKLVTRSVTQSMRDLARNIDAQMRKTFSFASFTRNMKARATGVSEVEIAMRDSLPFGGVEEIFLVHYETSILLQYLAREVNSETGEEYFVTQSDDSELISGMLTAVQDFVADAFGEEGEPGSLGDFQHGQKQVLIKAARFVYVAVVIHGVAPSNFGSKVQNLAYEIEGAYAHVLRSFDGDVSAFDAAQTHLRELMAS